MSFVPSSMASSFPARRLAATAIDICVPSLLPVQFPPLENPAASPFRQEGSLPARSANVIAAARRIARFDRKDNGRKATAAVAANTFKVEIKTRRGPPGGARRGGEAKRILSSRRAGRYYRPKLFFTPVSAGRGVTGWGAGGRGWREIASRLALISSVAISPGPTPRPGVPRGNGGENDEGLPHSRFSFLPFLSISLSLSLSWRLLSVVPTKGN